jgi:hypothetical protein
MDFIHNSRHNPLTEAVFTAHCLDERLNAPKYMNFGFPQDGSGFIFSWAACTLALYHQYRFCGA